MMWPNQIVLKYVVDPIAFTNRESPPSPATSSERIVCPPRDGAWKLSRLSRVTEPLISDVIRLPF